VTRPEVRVFLADDHPVVLAGIRALVEAEPGLRVVGEAADGNAALAGAIALRPHVLVLDISMPGLNGAQLAERLATACPDCRSLALTVHEEGAYIRRMLEVGVAGYVLKRSAATELVRAIHLVAEGGVHLDPLIAGEAIGRERPGAQADQDPAASGKLSGRETEVLRLTAAGHGNKEIARLLDISVKTVETHKARGMEKLGLRSRVALVQLALARGWLAEC
jgi:DNA-binding NarL/FixJ family response regulator